MNTQLPESHTLNADPFEKLKQGTLFDFLSEENQKLLTSINQNLQFTYQEFRQASEIIKDFEKWRITYDLQPVLSSFQGMPDNSTLKNQQRKVQKQRFIEGLIGKWNSLKNNPTQYDKNQSILSTKKLKVQTVDSGKKIYGKCPVASEKTVCCNLQTIDAVQNCGFGCTYCSIQTFYNKDYAQFEDNLAQKLREIPISKDKLHHFGTGQASDSLLWGDKNHILTDLFQFARLHENVMLEFKTKSDNVRFLDNLTPPKNAFFTWSMNTDTVISNEELRTPLSAQRIDAALKVVEKGHKVGFHFHPVIHYENWEQEYFELIQKVTTLFKPEDVVFVSIGTLTFIKPVIKELRKSQQETKILQIPLEKAVGGQSYSVEIKNKLFKHIYDSFKPWHEKVFFYLCMEESHYWHTTFGRCFENNKDFETAINTSIGRKLGIEIPETASTNESIIH